MSSERADQPATPDTPQGIPGQTLAAQREALGWSVEQVADQLKLAVRQVIALEAGDYASLPSPAVTRGFVRAYAKLMKLDPVPLVAQIAMDTPPAPDTSAATAARRPTPASFSQAKFPSHGKRVKLPLGWIAGAVVVVVAAGAAWHFGLIPTGHHEDAAATVATAPAAGGAAPETVNGSSVETLQNPSVPLISVPGASSSASAPAPAAATPAAGPVVNVPGAGATGAAPTTVPAPAATPAVTQTPPAVAATAAAAQQAAAAPAAAAPSGANALVLNVREDSWIEVRPAKGGAALISRLVKGGSTETVNVDGPVRVVVGNPGAVTATLRGNAVALPPVPGKTISRVNLQ